MIKELQNNLKRQWDTFTTSEQKIAAYLQHNISGIPFETAASLAQRVGVSPMTVGRFLRNLGYTGFADLKKSLRGNAPWLPLYKNPEHASEADFVAQSLRTDIRVLTALPTSFQRWPSRMLVRKTSHSTGSSAWAKRVRSHTTPMVTSSARRGW